MKVLSSFDKKREEIRTEEITYLCGMLSATTEDDTTRTDTIFTRLKELRIPREQNEQG